MFSDEDRKLLLAEDDKYGKRAIGQKEYRAYLKGQHLSFKSRILAYCYTCMGSYTDGKCDCEISTCPLHPVMPFRDVRFPGEPALEDGDHDGAKTDSTPFKAVSDPVEGGFPTRNGARSKSPTGKEQEAQG
ncbi:MAG: hypothetical protein ABSD81_02110 [Methanomicrobiales archaeon]|jgi:hypothetical protein